MEPQNIVKLALDYAGYFQIANMQDPDEIQGAAALFSYYSREKFTEEEKELVCRVATAEALRLRERLRREFGSAKQGEDPRRAYERQALEKEIAFYEGVPGTLYYFDNK